MDPLNNESLNKCTTGKLGTISTENVGLFKCK